MTELHESRGATLGAASLRIEALGVDDQSGRLDVLPGADGRYVVAGSALVDQCREQGD